MGFAILKNIRHFLEVGIYSFVHIPDHNLKWVEFLCNSMFTVHTIKIFIYNFCFTGLKTSGMEDTITARALKVRVSQSHIPQTVFTYFFADVENHTWFSSPTPLRCRRITSHVAVRPPIDSVSASSLVHSTIQSKEYRILN